MRRAIACVARGSAVSLAAAAPLAAPVAAAVTASPLPPSALALARRGGLATAYSPASRPFRPGDWKCSKCAAHNYRSRNTCFSCRTAKPAVEGTGPGTPHSDHRPGDWDCTCGQHNFMSRVTCHGCGKVRPDAPVR